MVDHAIKNWKQLVGELKLWGTFMREVQEGSKEVA